MDGENDLMTKPILNVYILIDRSASMQNKYVELCGAVNGYVAALKNVTPRVTVASFDDYIESHVWNNPYVNVTPRAYNNMSNYNFDVIRLKTTKEQWEDISPIEIQPRGNTPLYDAVCDMTDIMFQDSPKRAVLVIVTDGQENCSKRTTLKESKRLLNVCRNKEWEVVFLGADFFNQEQAESLGATMGKYSMLRAGVYEVGMNRLASESISYATSNKSIDLTGKTV